MTWCLIGVAIPFALLALLALSGSRPRMRVTLPSVAQLVRGCLVMVCTLVAGALILVAWLTS